MRISTRGRYGVRIMLELAISYNTGPLTRTVIARKQSLSAKYIHALLTNLMSAGLVYSQRGNRGGYHLAKPPEAISLLEIVEVLEGPIVLVDCVNDLNICDKSEICIAHDVWCELASVVKANLAKKSLADLIATDKMVIAAT